jgi:putative oxidoreductase
MQGLYINDASWLDTAGRLLIVAFFVIVGIRNLSKFHIEDHIKRLTMTGTPMPAAAFWAGIVLEFVGCALLLANWRPAIGVLCLIVFTVLATALLLRFWEADDPMKRIGMQNGFMSNVAIVGGLLLLLQNVR